MLYAWQTVEKAAVTLGISTRTIARRIAKGELESRLASGRREVYICLPASAVADGSDSGVETVEGELTGSDAPPRYRTEEEYEETVRHTVAASSAPGADVETSTALILAEDRARRAELAISVIQQSTAIVRDEVRTARAAARWAWMVVCVLACGVVGAVAWTSSNVTRSQMTADAMREKAAIANQHAEQLTREKREMGLELETARLASARIEGQLIEVQQSAEQARAMIIKALADRRATTRPASDEGARADGH